MTPVDAIWLFLVKMQPLSATLWLPALPPYIGVLVVLATPENNYLVKMAGYSASYSFNSTVGAQVEYKQQLQNCGEFYSSICFPSRDTTLQIITVGLNTGVFIIVH